MVAPKLSEDFVSLFLVTVLGVTVLYMPYSFLVTWNWNEDEPQHTQNCIQCSSPVNFVFLWLCMRTFVHTFSTFIIWDGTVFLHTVFIYIYIRWLILNFAVWNSWHRMVFHNPIFICVTFFAWVFSDRITNSNKDLQICEGHYNKSLTILECMAFLFCV
jgi:hypothetical protein